MSPVGSDCVNAKGEFIDDRVGEIHCIGLVMPAVNLESSHTSSVIDGCVLKATYRMLIGVLEAQNLHVYLNMMAWDLLGVPVCMDSPSARVMWHSTDPMTKESPVDACKGGLDSKIVFQIPTYSLWA